jgi:hypothetical protein
MNHCETCHWWCHATTTADTDWAVCVWHSGEKDTQAAQIKFRASPIQTHRGFWCANWEQDRKAKENA